ncbi:MAG TPA: hypothetical protein VFS43_45705 [Polyangiaceae bacterium]|nr:hypothetical protein [Polyangiaceae bacterium]
MPDAPKASDPPPPPEPRGPAAPQAPEARGRPSGPALAIGLAVAALAAAAAWSLRSRPPPPAAGAAASPSAPASASTPAAPRFAPPFAAALRAGGAVFVAGRRRGAGGLLLGSYDLEGRAAVELERAIEPASGRVAELDAFASPGGFVVSVEGEGGQRQWLRAASPERLADAAWEATEPSACATGREVVSLARAPEGLQARVAPIGGGAPSDAGAPLAGNAASLLCGRTRAYVLVERENDRVARALGPAPLDVSLGAEREQDEPEQSFAAYVAGDELVAVRLGAKSGLRFRSWDGAAREAGPWVRADLPPGDDVTIELALAAGDALALVTTRSVEPSRPCPDESGDVVAELSIVRRSDGVARRAGDRLETWRCGAEPGPFWGGTPGGRFVVAWPRGVDSACAKLGARYGGLTVASAGVEGKGAPRVERLGAPAEAIEDAGCDDERCVAVALGRGEPGACVGADDERAGAPRVLVYAGAKGASEAAP